MSLIGPTAERLRRAPDFDVPVVDEKRRRAAFRIVDVIETMFRVGKIREEQKNAFRQFEKDYTEANRGSALLSRYGERASGGGTPISQLASDLLCPEERRAEAFRKVSEAAQAVCEPRCVEMLIAVVTEQASLEDLGRRVLMVQNSAQAKAVASRTLQMATWHLAQHYGYLDSHPRPG